MVPGILYNGALTFPKLEIADKSGKLWKSSGKSPFYFNTSAY
jgi:hypothetical protein